MNNENNLIMFYGADWCRDCTKVKDFLNEHNHNYEYRDITDPEKGDEYSKTVIDINNGKRIIPTLLIDNEYYANPRLSDLNNLLEHRNSQNENITRCSNGKELHDGDTVLLTRDLDVKGSSLNLKQGTAIPNIKLTHDPAYIDAKIGKAKIAIKTMYIKKKG